MKTPSDIVGARVRAVRQRRGWTAAQLAERCTEHGAPEITASVVTDLETGRRDKDTKRRRRNITVDELLALACALDVAPVHLLVPTDGNDPYLVTHDRFVRPARAREWVRGRHPLPWSDPRLFFSEVPAEEWEPPEMTQEQMDRQGRMSEIRREVLDRGPGRRTMSGGVIGPDGEEIPDEGS
ncbi:helix-turn-helix domain-containing protein [Actinomadura sp. WAC 06369]|uniref:helix-turn-helix domain-containing protein n=1 Tax=Actinomadura sp. WAC 06369 TaxID=2203193 RepID=UPI0013155AD1|nr:helix-turn-helix transcriptional regulator [Actinomadura sp. WAC 06369]